MSISSRSLANFKGEVKVRRCKGAKNHLIVEAYGHSFVVYQETREVVVQNRTIYSNTNKPVDKAYYERLDYATKFSEVVDSYMRGVRGVLNEERTIESILCDFEKEYLDHLEKKTKESSLMYFAIIGKISSCLVKEDLQVILNKYPAFSHGESIRMALVDLYGGL